MCALGMAMRQIRRWVLIRIGAYMRKYVQYPHVLHPHGHPYPSVHIAAPFFSGFIVQSFQEKLTWVHVASRFGSFPATQTSIIIRETCWPPDPLPIMVV